MFFEGHGLPSVPNHRGKMKSPSPQAERTLSSPEMRQPVSARQIRKMGQSA